ncbi:MAG: 50S ribosomal protein L16, partial [Nanoarchaeota archaeon]
QGFHLKVRAYPHHFLRENPLASGAGADRMSTGMKKAFGKIVGMAAQLDKGQIIFTAYVNEPQLKRAKEALLKAAKKLPCSCGLKVEQKLEKSPVVSEETVEDAPEESPAAEAAEEPAKAEEAQ